MKIIFMGTPDFAVPILKAIKSEFPGVELVVTQPDRKKGRGHKLHASPVKVAAQDLGLNVISPESIRDNFFLQQLKQLNPDVVVVAAYGKIIPREILEIPLYGCINVHASLLPKYRGAAPIHWAVINGEEETGITIMQMNEGLDTGDIITQSKIQIAPNETTGSVHNRLAVLGASLLVSTLKNLKPALLLKKAQDEEFATYASKLDRCVERIDWYQTARQIHNLIRGLNPWPGAYAIINGMNIKVWKSEIIDKDKIESSPGRIYKIVDKEGIIIQAGKGLIMLTELQVAGKKKNSAKEFLKGYTLNEGDTFS